MSEWFHDWFDSPFYHQLYNHRDENEAQLFIKNLINDLTIKEHHTILDLACGKGRHTRTLLSNNLKVTGVDLSPQSIDEAILKDSQSSYYVHDMRKPFRINYFDFILNFFTSFGYFESEFEDIQALSSMRKGLKKDGVLILDYFNTQKVISNLVPSEIIQRDTTEFVIKRYIDNGKICKDIQFEHEHRSYHFTEKVSAFSLTDFQNLFSKSGLKLVEVWGDYHLQPYDSTNSPRMILKAIKMP